MQENTQNPDTRERILDVAEYEFMSYGYEGTSMRMITSKAEVNLAAINYHFGSKKALIQAVFSRFLGPFCVSLERELERRVKERMLMSRGNNYTRLATVPI